MRIGGLFFGYGGLDLAVQSVFPDASLAWYSEFDKGANKIAAHRFPDVPNHGDITACDWSQVEPIDILTGGSPCQDLSNAGSRSGMTDGTRSNLWVAMREGIAALRPRLVVWENVRGAFSATAVSEVEREEGLLGVRRGEPALRAFGRVLGDLSSLGYDAKWHSLRASDVMAPHPRFRVFVSATDAANNQTDHIARSMGSEQGEERRPRTADDSATLQRSRLAEAGAQGSRVHEWRELADAVARWERFTGNPAPSLHDDYPLIAEWLMGLPAGWVTDVPGITRNEALKALGNGVVPQQAAEALRVMAGWQVAS